MVGKMKRVVFLLRNYFTNDSRVLKEARTLTSTGYDVHIYCLWDGHLPKQENSDGITIHRLQYQSDKPGSRIKKLFAVFGLALKCTLKGRCDVVHCHDLETLPIGFMIKKLYGARLVYDAHEYETERVHLTGSTKKLCQIVERSLIGSADAVITVSDSIANEYHRLYGIPKPTLVLNCPPYKEAGKYNHFREHFNLREDQIIFLYQGGLSPQRGIERTLDAFSKLDDHTRVVVFMGYGPLEDTIKNASKESKVIFYHNAVPVDILFEYTSSADVGLMLIENSCLSYYYCSPNKFFEYAMSRLPIIVSNLFEMRRIVEKYNNGIVIEEEADLMESVKGITHEKIKDMKLSDLPPIYNWENQEIKLLATYEALPI